VGRQLPSVALVVAVVVKAIQTALGTALPEARHCTVQT
jgi:hypothetical protein